MTLTNHENGFLLFADNLTTTELSEQEHLNKINVLKNYCQLDAPIELSNGPEYQKKAKVMIFKTQLSLTKKRWFFLESKSNNKYLMFVLIPPSKAHVGIQNLIKKGKSCFLFKDYFPNQSKKTPIRFFLGFGRNEN